MIMHSKIKKILKIGGIIFTSSLILFALFFLSIYIGIFGSLPDNTELAAIHKEEASLVLSSDGSLLGKYFAENRTNISRIEIPDHLINALIATEDKRFYQHEGYDMRSYLRVFFKTILMGNRSAGGGSTITQQLIKNLYGRNYHNFLSMPINKVKEAIIAARLEKVFSKEEVLVLYLNSVPFGENVYGIEAAATRYFDKHAIDLNIQESAVLVGILKANTYYNPRLNPDNAERRRNQVIALMKKETFLSKIESDSIKALPLELSYANYQKESPAAYFVHQVKRKALNILETQEVATGIHYDIEKDGLQIYTSLDIQLQDFAQDAVSKQLKKMQSLLDKELKRSAKRQKWEKSLANNYSIEALSTIRKREIFEWDGMKTEDMSLADSLWHYHKMLNAAVLIADPKTGKVLTWIGGNHYRYLAYDLIYAKRQIASAIKPLIYAAALETELTPCSYLNNEAKTYEDYNGWKPENYNRVSTPDSTVALWYALANSMNVPTVDLYFQTGHQAVADLLRRLKIQAPKEETPAIALGSLDISLFEIIRAYSTFANEGEIYDDLQMIDKITDASGNIIYESKTTKSQEVISPEICSQLTAILQKAVNEGTGTQIRRRFGIQADLAGKTGTSQNYSNAWFMSYTPNLVIGTWVGARSPEIHFRGGLGSGSALALPISGEIISQIEKEKQLKAQYLTPFTTDSLTLALLDCPAYHEKGLSGFVHRLTTKDEEKAQLKKGKAEKRLSKKEERKARRKKKKEDKEKSGVRKFFDKVFGGKDEEK
ncbi:MAG: hypothetical protein GQ527_07720 [Bacteroidales bacterium]|nr:hypothetical protein [Bacteroidales bacterium]